MGIIKHYIAYILLSIVTGWGGLSAQNRLKVVSFNVRMSGEMVGYQAKPFADFIKLHNPDFILLQEVDFNTNRNGNKDFATELAAELGMFSAFGKAISYSNGEYGVALLSKYPLLQTQLRAITTSLPAQKEARALLYADIRMPESGKTIRIASTHLDHSDVSVRTEMVKQINSFLFSSGIPTILAGDYNASPGESSIATGMAAWQRICDNTATYPATNPVSKIDYIFGLPKEGWIVHSYTRILNTGLSDHLPLIADIELK